MVSWVERQHRKDEKCKKEKKKSRLKTDKTNIYIVYEEEDGRKQCPRFQLCSSPPPLWRSLSLHGRKVTASVGRRVPQTLASPQAKPGHFIPALKPQNKYSPSEV